MRYQRIVFLFIVVIAALLIFIGTFDDLFAQETWDKSSITVVSTGCDENGANTATVLNHGLAMSGPVTSTLFVNGIGTPFIAHQFGNWEYYTYTLGIYMPGDVLELIVYQRPGHPGIGYISATAKGEDCIPPENTPTSTPTSTSTSTATSTATNTGTPTPTSSSTITPTSTMTNTATATSTNTSTNTSVPSETMTPTKATKTMTPTPTSTATATVIITITRIPTNLEDGEETKKFDNHVYLPFVNR